MRSILAELLKPVLNWDSKVNPKLDTKFYCDYFLYPGWVNELGCVGKKLGVKDEQYYDLC